MSSKPTAHIEHGHWDIHFDIGGDGRPILQVPGKLSLTMSAEHFPVFAARVDAIVRRLAARSRR